MKKDNNIILSNNLTYYMDKNGIDRNQLCKDLDFCYSTVSEWLSAQKYPRMDKIEKLARYFGVKKSDLIENKNPPLAKNNNEITEVELQHIKKYRQLDPYGQEAVESILDIEYKRCKAAPAQTIEPEEEEPTIEIRCAEFRVSAGFGVPLDDSDQWKTIYIPDNHETQNADFALKIKGDSMEPVYREGDIVLVKKQDVIDEGEVGIFIIEGEGYVKKYGGDRLISLNAKYDDIMFEDYDEEQIRYVGKVLGRV